MRIANWQYTAAELAPFAAEVAGEATRAREGLAGRIARTDFSWSRFRRTNPDLPEIRWPDIWEYIYDGMVTILAAEEEARRKAAAAKSPFGGFSAGLLNQPWLTNIHVPGPVTDSGAIAARRYDELLAGHVRARQQVEDYEAELGRLQLEHAEIVRPDARLWWGIGILIIFTATGVALPLWVMAEGPHDLARVRWVFYPFAVSLAALIVYIVIYLIQLTTSKRD
jgi:hypothetical protein